VDVGQYLIEWLTGALFGLVVLAIVIGGAVWLILRPMSYQYRPRMPKGKCLCDGTNCKGILPKPGYTKKMAVPPRVCRDCPFVKRSV
jgi:hypothetical protein